MYKSYSFFTSTAVATLLALITTSTVNARVYDADDVVVRGKSITLTSPFGFVNIRKNKELYNRMKNEPEIIENDYTHITGMLPTRTIPDHMNKNSLTIDGFATISISRDSEKTDIDNTRYIKHVKRTKSAIAKLPSAFSTEKPAILSKTIPARHSGFASVIRDNSSTYSVLLVKHISNSNYIITTESFIHINGFIIKLRLALPYNTEKSIDEVVKRTNGWINDFLHENNALLIGSSKKSNKQNIIDLRMKLATMSFEEGDTHIDTAANGLKLYRAQKVMSGGWKIIPPNNEKLTNTVKYISEKSATLLCASSSTIQETCWLVPAKR